MVWHKLCHISNFVFFSLQKWLFYSCDKSIFTFFLFRKKCSWFKWQKHAAVDIRLSSFVLYGYCMILSHSGSYRHSVYPTNKFRQVVIVRVSAHSKHIRKIHNRKSNVFFFFFLTDHSHAYTYIYIYIHTHNCKLQSVDDPACAAHIDAIKRRNTFISLPIASARAAYAEQLRIVANDCVCMYMCVFMFSSKKERRRCCLTFMNLLHALAMCECTNTW